ncbi:MAG: hypothetical protein LWX02_12685, partial [Deltaproteobacteria bacterium]|nr:hypothetical protein [Deltaproteobacteria bacterium]
SMNITGQPHYISIILDQNAFITSLNTDFHRYDNRQNITPKKQISDDNNRCFCKDLLICEPKRLGLYFDE